MKGSRRLTNKSSYGSASEARIKHPWRRHTTPKETLKEPPNTADLSRARPLTGLLPTCFLFHETVTRMMAVHLGKAAHCGWQAGNFSACDSTLDSSSATLQLHQSLRAAVREPDCRPCGQLSAHLLSFHLFPDNFFFWADEGL